MRGISRVNLVVVILSLIGADTVQATMIGLNFSGGWPLGSPGPYPLAAGDNTGASPQQNWNNWQTGAAQDQTWATSPALSDNLANLTALTITVGNPILTQLQDDGPGPGNGSGGIQTLFEASIRANTDGGPTWAYSSGMPYSLYTLYVYADSSVTVTQGGGSGDGTIAGFTIASGYQQNVNYVRFTGMSGDFRFSTGNHVYGIQIEKEGDVPEPGTILVLGASLVWLCGSGMRRHLVGARQPAIA